MKFLTLAVFLMSTLAHSAPPVRATDPAKLKEELSKEDGITRIVLAVRLTDKGEPNDGASKKSIKALTEALTQLGKNKRKDVKGILVPIWEEDFMEALKELPRFPKNGPRAYPYFAFFKNGGVQNRLIGYAHQKEHIITQVGSIDRFKEVPKSWEIKPADISLQYLYQQDKCKVSQFKSETIALRKIAKKLGVLYSVVDIDEVHPDFKDLDPAPKGLDIFFSANPNGYFGENDCRQITAIVNWQEKAMSTSFSVQEDRDTRLITEEILEEAVKQLETGNY